MLLKLAIIYVWVMGEIPKGILPKVLQHWLQVPMITNDQIKIRISSLGRSAFNLEQLIYPWRDVIVLSRQRKRENVWGSERTQKWSLFEASASAQRQNAFLFKNWTVLVPLFTFHICTLNVVKSYWTIWQEFADGKIWT